MSAADAPGVAVARVRAAANFADVARPHLAGSERVFARIMRGADVVGGMWIPGIAELGPTWLAYRAYALPRLLYGEAARITIPLGEVEGVTVRAGIASRTAFVAFAGGTLRLRGFHVNAFAAQLQVQLSSTARD